MAKPTYWEGTTSKDVATLVRDLQSQSGSWIPRMYRLSIRPEWKPISSVDVFKQGQAPADWSASFGFDMPNGSTGECELEIFDNGDHRVVAITPVYSLNSRARVKNIYNGMIEAVS